MLLPFPGFKTLNKDHVSSVAADCFNVSGSIRELDCYDDRTFLINDDHQGPVVLKISSPETPLWEIEGQNALLTHLAAYSHHLSYPKLLKTTDGFELLTGEMQNGDRCVLRLMTFLEGTFLSDITDKQPYAKNLGESLGEMDKALEGFYHPGLRRKIDWDIVNCPELGSHLQFVEDSELRRLIDYYLLQYEVNVQPILKNLPYSVIHNDVHADNVLLNGDKAKLRLSGLIDYGDAVYTATVCNLAISLTYTLFGQEDKLKIAEEMVAGYHRYRKLSAEEVDVIYYLIAARLCVSLLMCMKRRAEGTASDYTDVSFADAAALLREMIEINPLAMQNRLRAACQLPEITADSQQQILGKRSEKLGRNLSIAYSNKPLTVVRGAMQYLLDDTGETYLDCVNNVCHVGHAHPRIVRAMHRQMATLNTNTRYLHGSILEYAERLTATMPDPLSVCFFVNSGSEANDLALRLARTYTGRRNIAVLDGAYHGHTNSIIELSPYKFEGKGGAGKVESTIKLDMPDTFRGRYRIGHENPAASYIADIEHYLKKVAQVEALPAAFFAESLLGCGGQIIPPAGYLKGAYEAMRSHGVVSVADEVQVGFGRVGSHFWGFDMQDALPDIVTLGKPIGNGHPLAAVVTTAEIADAFANGMEYFNTFGGNPVSCAIGLTVLDIIEEEELQEHALEVGSYLKERLSENNHPLIGDVRGAGLFIGVELIRDKDTLEPATREAAAIKDALREEHILISTDGPFENVLKIKPPLVFSRKNADRLVSAINNALQSR